MTPERAQEIADRILREETRRVVARSMRWFPQMSLRYHMTRPDGSWIAQAEPLFDPEPDTDA